jgi:hypothetical protein
LPAELLAASAGSALLAQYFYSFLYYFTFKLKFMPNPKTDAGGFSTSNADEERDMGAKGGPATGLGQPDDKHGVVAPYDSDLQTQIVAKGKNKKDQRNKPNHRSSL